ncbi:MAG: hypothetical protein KDE19_19775, partial [Caldilineaceae bacterium]|nr:hypothetical protein [Caldilineaceae bacterium]
MNFVEVIVNRPIRRSFRPTPDTRASQDPLTDPAATLDPLSDSGLAGVVEETSAALQLFHYHLPVELEGVAQPGHLVWVPFGAQEVQGFIVNRTESSPVPTRAVLRLARPEPVLTAAQMALAAWIADYYVAPLAEAVKLFLPPGLLSKEDGTSRARAKRELRIQLAVTPEEVARRLPSLGRETQQVRVLNWFLAQSTAGDTHSPLLLETVQHACRLKTPATLKTLARQGILVIEDAFINTEQDAAPHAATIEDGDSRKK